MTRSPAARQDLLDLANYLALDSMDAAMRFLAAADTTFQFLASQVEIGQRCEFKHPDTADMRVWQVDGFPNHLVFYRSTDVGVEIVRVIHGARDIEAIFSSHD